MRKIFKKKIVVIFIKQFCISLLLFLLSCKKTPERTIKTDVQKDVRIDSVNHLNKRTVLNKQGDLIESNKKSNELELKSFFSDNVKIKIPVNFGLMNKDYVKLKYPSLNPNTVKVYSNHDGTISLLLELSNRKLKPISLEEMKNEISNNFEKYPSIFIQESQIREINNKEFIVVKFTSQAFDSRIFNMMFITSVDDRVFTGTFNCTFTHLSEWQSKSIEILNSVLVN